jgi:uncharacterized membrane protein
VASTTSSRTAAIDDRFTSQDWALFLAVAGIWGSSFLFIDIGLDALPPGVITLMRVGLGALALAVLPRKHTSIRSEDRVRLVTLSVVWVAVPFTLFPIAEQHISSAVAGLLNGGTPIFAAIFAMVLLRQPTRGAQLLGIAVGFVGVVLVSLPSIGEGSSETFGVVLVVLATVCYGFAVTLAGPMQQRYGSVNLMAKVLALATIWTAPYGLWQVGARGGRARRRRHGHRVRTDGHPRRPGRLDSRVVHHVLDPGGCARSRRGVPWRRGVRSGTDRRGLRDRRCLPGEQGHSQVVEAAAHVDTVMSPATCHPPTARRAGSGVVSDHTPGSATNAGRISPIWPTISQSA